MAPDGIHRTSPDWFFPLWVTVGCAALLAGAAVPTNFMGYWTSIEIFHWGEGNPSLYLWRFNPAALAAVCLAALCLQRNTSAGAVVTVSSAVALLAALLEIHLTVKLSALWNWILMIGGAALIAAGNHTMKRVPEKRLPGIVAGIGGVRLFLSFLAEGEYFSKSTIYRMMSIFHMEQNPEAHIFAWLLLTYSVLAILSPFVRSRPKFRCRVISLLGYVLLCLFPVALHREWMSLSGWRHDSIQDRHLDFMLKFWLLGTGYVLVLSAGLATWMERHLAQRQDSPALSPTPSPGSEESFKPE